MSEYGLRIKNIQAASIYEYQYGVRDQLDQTDAMLTNSLFLDYLLDNKLINIWKEESTRDIICLEFSYGVKNKDGLKKMYEKIENKDNISEETKNAIKEKKEFIENLPDDYKKYSREEIRKKYYKEGFSIEYKTHNKNGKVIKTEIIEYRMLYRTPGKAKKGTCMFINADIYDKVHNFLYMGLMLPKENSPIVEVGAYSSLITSSIVGRVKIDPDQILVVKDVDSFFKTSALLVNTDENKECYIERKDEYEVKNTMFDGQALIDYSIFPSFGNGYILLRHHFTKVAAFKTNIEQFMKDQFGYKYEFATVKDMFGRDVKVKNIKLITTDNAFKWLKFGVSYEYWSNWVRKNNCQFGIVKTAHESKLGNVQRMSYQMMNALDINSMEDVCSTAVEYINQLKNNDDVFLDYLWKNQTFSNDYEVLLALVNHNIDFVYSSYFRERRKQIINSYLLDFKNGHCIQNGDNLTIVGSPYAMLLHSIGKDYKDDPTFSHEDGVIQCYTERFKPGEYLAEFRSPFNSRNNLGYLHNVDHELFKKYFDFGQLIIAINMIETDFQDRNNGSDQDSDGIYVTNQKSIVEHAKYCYDNYPTIVNGIKPEKNSYSYSMESFAEVDIKLAAAQRAIGESSNLAQLALTYSYTFDNQKYNDYVCILSVLAQIAIDNAKRTFNVDLSKEIPRIRGEMNIEENGLPQFWYYTKRDKQKVRTDKQRQERDKKNKEKISRRINKNLICPMNYLCNIKIPKFRSGVPTKNMKEFWIEKEKNNKDRRISNKVEKLISNYSLKLYKFNTSDEEEKESKCLLLIDDFENLIKDIRGLYISMNYIDIMSLLINRALFINAGIKANPNEKSTLHTNRSILLKTLYTVNPNAFLSCFVQKSV